jgi:branched-chain amino acid transport system substrate-binding protein
MSAKVPAGACQSLKDEHLETHVSILKRSGAELVVFAGVPPKAAKVIRLAADINWHPTFILNQMASSITTGLKPAGLDNAVGVVTAAYLKDADDPAWKGGQSVSDWEPFLEEYMRIGGTDESAAMFGYAAAETLAHARAVW